MPLQQGAASRRAPAIVPTISLTVSRLSADAVARHATEAAARLSPYIVRTPVVAAGALGARGSGRVWYKCENLQRTGSFKIRGALNKLLVVGAAERERGVVTASTGNHGLAVGTALQVTGGRGTVHVAPSTTPSKLDRIRATGMAVEFCGDGPLGAELQARAKAAAEGRIFISPYNDPDVIAGQGTIGIEMAEQIATAEAVYVAVGGGGLIAGIAAALDAVRPSVRIVGCWPEASPAMLQSIKAGRVVSVPDAPTLSDGTAGNIEDGALTLPLCRDLID